MLSFFILGLDTYLQVCQVAHRCSMGYFDTLTFKMLIIKLIYEQLSKAPYRACLLKEPFGAI